MSEKDFYDVHVFCCVNERHDGHPRGCCKHRGAEKLRDYMKKRGKELRRDLGGRRLRVNQAGCLDRCELGPVMVIYPEGTWYHYRSEEDVDEILNRHILGGETVARLRLAPEQTELSDPVPSTGI